MLVEQDDWNSKFMEFAIAAFKMIKIVPPSCLVSTEVECIGVTPQREERIEMKVMETFEKTHARRLAESAWRLLEHCEMGQW